ERLVAGWRRRRALHGVVQVGRSLVQVGLNVVHRRLYRLRGGARFLLDLLELREFHLAIDVALYLVDIPLRLADPFSDRARNLRHAFRPEDDKGHDADDGDLTDTEVEHPRPRDTPAAARNSGRAVGSSGVIGSGFLLCLHVDGLPGNLLGFLDL